VREDLLWIIGEEARWFCELTYFFAGGMVGPMIADVSDGVIEKDI
jgi:hypothetical protein